MQSPELLIIGCFLVLVLLSTIFLPQWQLRRALRKLISDFRKEGAVSPDKAISPEIVDSHAPRSALPTLFKWRDWRGIAIQSLLKAEIIKTNGAGKYYLAEDRIPPAYK